MAKVRRNGPCPCGSGNKAKRCCHKERSAAAESPTRLLPLEVCRDAALDLEGVSNAEIHALFDEMIYLPEIDISLQVPLPAIFTPDIDRAISALDDDDGEAFDRELNQVVPTVDTPERRIELAEQSSHCVSRVASHPSSPPSLSSISMAKPPPSSSPRSLNPLPFSAVTSALPPGSWWQPDRSQSQRQTTLAVAYWRALVR